MTRTNQASGTVYSAVFPHSRKELIGGKGGSKVNSHHSVVYDILNPSSRSRAAVNFKQFISVVIVVDCLIFIVSTEPDLADLPIFEIFRGISSSIFLVEYIARLVVCTEQRRYARFGPFLGRLDFMLSYHALVDAVATFPFFLRWICGLPLPTLTFVRVFRLLRITRTNGYSKAMNALGRVFFFNRDIIYVTAMLGGYLVIMTSVLIYFLRPRGTDVDIVDDITVYNSIANTMALSVLLIADQGAPSGKLPWYTQCAVLLAGTCSLAMIAIPSSLLTWGLDAEAQRLGTKEKRKASSDTDARRSSISSDSSEDDTVWDGASDTQDMDITNVRGGREAQQEQRDDFSLYVLQSDEKRAMLSSLQDRMEKLERTYALMNDKLDILLSKLQ